jgi:hypothetical protein
MKDTKGNIGGVEVFSEKEETAHIEFPGDNALIHLCTKCHDKFASEQKWSLITKGFQRKSSGNFAETIE